MILFVSGHKQELGQLKNEVYVLGFDPKTAKAS